MPCQTALWWFGVFFSFPRPVIELFHNCSYLNLKLNLEELEREGLWEKTWIKRCDEFSVHLPAQDRRIYTLIPFPKYSKSHFSTRPNDSNYIFQAGKAARCILCYSGCKPVSSVSCCRCLTSYIFSGVRDPLSAVDVALAAALCGQYFVSVWDTCAWWVPRLEPVNLMSPEDLVAVDTSLPAQKHPPLLTHTYFTMSQFAGKAV